MLIVTSSVFLCIIGRKSKINKRLMETNFCGFYYLCKGIVKYLFTLIKFLCKLNTKNSTRIHTHLERAKIIKFTNEYIIYIYKKALQVNK